MKLKDFKNQLDTLIKSYPEALEMDVIYSKDDEGNDFQEVHFAPSIGKFENREFDSSSNGKIEGANAVCIN